MNTMELLPTDGLSPPPEKDDGEQETGQDEEQIVLIEGECFQLFYSGQLDEGEAMAKQMIEDFPQSAVGHRYLSLACRLRKLFKEATESATVAVRLGPDDPANYDALAKSLFEAGHIQAAARVAQDGVFLDNGDGFLDLQRAFDAAKTDEEQARVIDQVKVSLQFVLAAGKRLGMLQILKVCGEPDKSKEGKG